jgi:hypothetical protein
MSEIKHIHWLYGSGADKELHFKEAVAEETKCSQCIHVRVCSISVEKRCVNFERGTSLRDGCACCVHHYTRFDRQPVPCFLCRQFLDVSSVRIGWQG